MNDELRRAISIAQTAHDRNDGPADNTAVAIGALIRAVTILAGAQPTSREEAINVYKETRDAAVRAFGGTSSADGSVSGDLVKGLIETFVRGTKNGVLPTGEGVRAILSELASASIELPSQSQIVQAMRDEIRGWGPEKAVEFTRKRIAHFLAAKNIEIKEAKSEIESLKSRLVEQSARESRLHVVLSDHGLPTEPKALARELDQRNAPMTVDGKTPGQVFDEAFRNGFGKRVVPNPDSELVRTHSGELVRDYQREQALDWANATEIGALAVLRVFGQPNQTPSTNVVEVFNKLASYWEKDATYDGMPEQYRRGLKDCAKDLREELAKLSTEPPNDVGKAP